MSPSEERCAPVGGKYKRLAYKLSLLISELDARKIQTPYLRHHDQSDESTIPNLGPGLPRVPQIWPAARSSPSELPR